MHQKLMVSILGRCQSSIQVWRKSVGLSAGFLCNPAGKPTNQQTYMGEIITSLAKLTNNSLIQIGSQ